MPHQPYGRVEELNAQPATGTLLPILIHGEAWDHHCTSIAGFNAIDYSLAQKMVLAAGAVLACGPRTRVAAGPIIHPLY